MKTHKLRNILLIAGTAITAILAVVVILISSTLQQRGSEPVAPNVPSSKPQAAIPEAACMTTFVVEEPTVYSPICAEKTAYRNSANDAPGKYVEATPIAAGTALYPGDIIIFKLKGQPVAGALTDVKWQDIVDSRFEIMDMSSQCSTNSAFNGNPIVNCVMGNIAANGAYNAYIRVKVKANATAGDFTNTAQISTGTSVEDDCSLALKIVPNTALTCAKQVFQDNKNVTTYTVANMGSSDYPIVANDATVPLDKTLVFVPKLKNPATQNATNLTVTDVLDANLTYVDGLSNCTYESANRTVTCTGVSVNAGQDVLANAAFRVKVPATVTETITISNSFTVSGANVTTATCATNVKVSPPGSTPTPTPTATPTPTPTTTPTPTPTPTPAPGCNNSCSASNACASGLTCVSGTCRNNACSAKTNCVCDVVVNATATPTPTASPAPSTLPQAGSTAETFGVVAVGIVITILGVIGLFAL